MRGPALPGEYGHEILRVEVGSTLHGTGLPGGEDLDLMGVYVEGPASTIGLGSKPHWIKRTAPEGVRSGPGDIDLTMYSLRKWAALALKGNPSVLLLLYAPDDKVDVETGIGRALRQSADLYASKRAGHAFLGYMRQQRQRMTGERGRAGRVRVMPEGQIDWKYAHHMLRLGYQGVEYLQTGKITLPVPDEVGALLREVRRGDVPIESVIAEAEMLEDQVEALLRSSPLPDEPKTWMVERFVIQAHLDVWEGWA